MNKLYETNRGVFWLITCSIAGIVWAVFQSNLGSGLVYAGILFAFAIVYEVFLNKHNRSK